MTETALRKIEHEIAVGRTLPGRDGYALATMAALVDEVRRLQGVEREALRVLGAIINQHVPRRIDVPEEALRRDYTVSRTNDPASMTVRFRAEPADER